MANREAVNDLVERVIGAAIEVHRHLGPGFAEATYHRALMVELEDRGIEYTSEVPVDLMYKGRTIGGSRLDLLVEGQLVVELKATAPNAKRYRRQVVAYLKATDLDIGLVINFEEEVLRDGIARVAN